MIIGICITVYVIIFYTYLVFSGIEVNILNDTGKCPSENHTRESQGL